MRVRPTLWVLTLAAGLAACADSTDPLAPEFKTSPPGNGSRGIAAMSRNLYLGADLDPLVTAIAAGASQAELLALVGETWGEILATDFTFRAAALASEVGEYRPHLLGLQEVSTYILVPLDPATFQPVGPPQVVFDFLASLQAALGAANLDYHVASAQSASTVQLAGIVANPAAGYAPGLYLIIWQDADVILARGDVVTSGATGGTYAQTVPIAPGVEITRGWTAVEAAVGGRALRFVNTHLETQGPGGGLVNAAQALELLGITAAWPGAVLLAGDFNSAANPGAPAASQTPAYGAILAAGYTDLYTAAVGVEGGLTCCHASDLGAGGPGFTQRIDFVFARGVGGSGWPQTAKFDVLGEEPGDQFSYVNPLFGPLTQWPSDHAGVVASLAGPARP